MQPNQDPSGTHLLIVLQGTLQIKIEVSHKCIDFCRHSNKLLTLSQGDMRKSLSYGTCVIVSIFCEIMICQLNSV